MNIIINNSSMTPIYEQIVEQIKHLIVIGKLKEHDNLPSVRGLSRDLKISALTVKKAYDTLEQAGYIITIHGKGSYVASTNVELVMEEQRRQVEESLEKAISDGISCGMTSDDIREIFRLIMEEYEND